MRAALGDIGLTNAPVEVGGDTRIARAGALAGEPGILAIAGTGSSRYGRSASGALWIAGGIGSRLDDQKGGYELGCEALVACVRAHGARVAATALSDLLGSQLRLRSWRDLSARSATMPRAEIVTLALLATAAELDGDTTAQCLIDASGDARAECVATVAREIDEPAPRFAVTGGFARSAAPWRAAFERAVLRRLRDACLVEAKMPPVLGAASLAAESARVVVDGRSIQ